MPEFLLLAQGKDGAGPHPRPRAQGAPLPLYPCGKTFAAAKNTPYYRLYNPLDLVTIIRPLLCHACPRQAIVAAYGLDERTVVTIDLTLTAAGT